MSSRILRGIAVTLLLNAAVVCWSAPGDLVRVIKNPSPQAGDKLENLAVCGDKVLIAGSRHHLGTPRKGAAFMMDLNGDALLRTFTHPANSMTGVKVPTNSGFGDPVALTSDCAIITDHNDSTAFESAGAVYVFDAATGAVRFTLREPGPPAGNEFGAATAAFGDDLLIGAIQRTQAFYLFSVATGKPVRTFTNPAYVQGDGFGSSSFAETGGRVVTGAFGYKNAVGVVYVFDKATGDLVRTIENPVPTQSSLFGLKVAVAGNVLAVSAPTAGKADVQPGTTVPSAVHPVGPGAVHLFDATTGTLLRTLESPAPHAQENFGLNMVAAGTWLLVFGWNAKGDPEGAGVVYLFDPATCKLLHTFRKPNPEADDAFGASMAFAGDKILISAPHDSTSAKDAGAVYVFEAPLEILPPTETEKH